MQTAQALNFCLGTKPANSKYWPEVMAVRPVQLKQARLFIIARFTLQKIFGTARVKLARVPKRKGSARIKFAV